MALLAVLSVLLLLTVPLSQAVQLEWDQNTDSPDGYRLHYGYAPDNYHETIDVGGVTTYEVTGLALNQGYYFVVTAYNEHGESDYSNMVFHFNAASGGLVGSIISYVTEVCDDPPDPVLGTNHGDGYEVIFSQGKMLIYHDILHFDDNVRLGF